MTISESPPPDHRGASLARFPVMAKPAKPAKLAASGKPRTGATAKIAHTPHRFDGKVVITTGAASGLGRATVLRLALEDAAIEGGQSCKY